MARSLKKGPYVHPSITKWMARVKPGQMAAIKTWARSSTITPEMIGYTFAVHNGRTFIEVQRMDGQDEHHPLGPSHTIDLDELFKKDER